MTYYFDGKKTALEKEKKLVKRFVGSRKSKKVPVLASILVGNNRASKLYLRIKKNAAERVGAKVLLRQFPNSVKKREIIDYIKQLNIDNSVRGIMIQLPLPSNFSMRDRNEIINTIAKGKDVDGMRDKSPYTAPLVKAVIEVMKRASVYLQGFEAKVVVIGHKGFEGQKIKKVMEEMGYEVIGIDKGTKKIKDITQQADVIISATGSHGLVKESMVRGEVVLIDVGSPKGDVDKKAYMKASFASPVPGGIGPLTVIELMENLLES